MAERTKQQNKQIKKTVVGVVALLVGFLAVRGGLAYYDSSRFTQAYESNFISSCTAQGASNAYCSCAVHYMEDHYTQKELLEMEKSGDFPVKEVLNQCS